MLTVSELADQAVLEVMAAFARDGIRPYAHNVPEAAGRRLQALAEGWIDPIPAYEQALAAIERLVKSDKLHASGDPWVVWRVAHNTRLGES